MPSEMKSRAESLASYCQAQVDDALRAVGFHTAEEYEFVWVREDLAPKYASEDAERFVRISQAISSDLQALDENMGAPEASLHVLEDGLAVQFHYPDQKAAFVSVDKGVGQNFTSFVADCQDKMGSAHRRNE